MITIYIYIYSTFFSDLLLRVTSVQKLVGCKEMGEEVLKSVDSQVAAAL